MDENRECNKETLMKLKEEEWTLCNLKKRKRQDKLHEVHLKKVKEESFEENTFPKNEQKNKIILDLFVILINDLINAKKFRLKQDEDEDEDEYETEVQLTQKGLDILVNSLADL